MTLTPKILADGQLPAVKTTLYTVPAVTIAAVKFVRLVNTTAGALTLNLYLKKSGGTSRRIVPKDYSLAAGAMLDVMDAVQTISLAAGDVMEGDCSSATSVDYVIDGGEVA
jgi:hypothetical protein